MKNFERLFNELNGIQNEIELMKREMLDQPVDGNAYEALRRVSTALNEAEDLLIQAEDGRIDQKMEEAWGKDHAKRYESVMNIAVSVRHDKVNGDDLPISYIRSKAYRRLADAIQDGGYLMCFGLEDTVDIHNLKKLEKENAE